MRHFNITNAINRAHPQGQGLLALYPMNEGAGSIAYDLTGTYNGTFTNSAAWVNGKYSKAASFNGVTGSAYITSGINKTLIGNNFSFSLMIKPNSILGGVFSMAGTPSSNGPYILCDRPNAASLNWYLFGGDRITQTSVANGSYYHVVLTYDGTTWRTYLNGVATGTYTGTTGGNLGTALYIGNGYSPGSNFYYNGAMHDFRVYGRTLSAMEVADIYMNPGNVYFKKQSSVSSLPPNIYSQVNGVPWGAISGINGLSIGNISKIGGLST